MTQVSIPEDDSQARQAVFFATGFSNSIVEQYIKVAKYCAKNHLAIVNIFVEESNDIERIYTKLHEILEFTNRQQRTTAIVVATKYALPPFISIEQLADLFVNSKTELHIVRSKSMIYKH